MPGVLHDPHETPLTRVNRVDLLNWVSPTQLRIRDKVLEENGTATAIWHEYYESLQFSPSLRLIADCGEGHWSSWKNHRNKHKPTPLS